MPTTNRDVKIYFETMGPENGIPLIFVQGFTGQLISWGDGFLQAFVDRGARVIVFDNRDVGLSDKTGGPADYDGGYGLDDMAADAFSVLDALGIHQAHVVGASMGGMIAQVMALSQPSRVKSLNLFYTAPQYDPKYFPPRTDESMDLTAERTREETIEQLAEAARGSASPEYGYDIDAAKIAIAKLYDRDFDPMGFVRQGMAVTRWAATPEALSDLDMPSTIIHGREDQRLFVEAAFELDRLLKHSELHVYRGMGHETPEPLWGEFASIVMRTASRA